MLISGAVNAAVYKWVDSDGQTHYGDESRRGSTKVKLNETTVYTPPPSHFAPEEDETEEDGADEVTDESDEESGEAAAEDGKSSKSDTPVVYDLLMKTPNQNETVRTLDGKISFSFNVAPDVPEEYKLKLSIDGRHVNQPISGLRFSIGNIPFGLHQAQGWLYDGTGKQVAKSELVTFTLRRAVTK